MDQVFGLLGFRTRPLGEYHVAGTGKTVRAWAVIDRGGETVQEFSDIVSAIRSANRMNRDYVAPNRPLSDVVDDILNPRGKQ